MTVAEAIQHCRESLQALYGENEARNMAGILLEYLTKIRYPKGDKELDSIQLENFYKLFNRLKNGEPIQYVVGHTWFYGLKFKTDSRALIPRPETEELVHWVLEQYSGNKFLRVLDIGTGSGCIAISLKQKRAQWEVWAIDKSTNAISLCDENGAILHSPVKTIVCDILEQTLGPEWPKFDIIVSNPPYIPPSEKSKMSRQVVDYEPYAALFVPESDPLVFYKAIASFASGHLNTSGVVFFEINEFHAEELTKILRRWFGTVEIRRDMQGKLRMVKASHCVN